MFILPEIGDIRSEQQGTFLPARYIWLSDSTGKHYSLLADDSLANVCRRADAGDHVGSVV